MSMKSDLAQEWRVKSPHGDLWLSVSDMIGIAERMDQKQHAEARRRGKARREREYERQLARMEELAQLDAEFDRA